MDGARARILPRFFNIPLLCHEQTVEAVGNDLQMRFTGGIQYQKILYPDIYSR